MRRRATRRQRPESPSAGLPAPAPSRCRSATAPGREETESIPASASPGPARLKLPVVRNRWPGSADPQSSPPRISSFTEASTRRPSKTRTRPVAGTAQRLDNPGRPGEASRLGMPATSISATTEVPAAMAAATAVSFLCTDATAECAPAAHASSSAAATVARKLPGKGSGAGQGTTGQPRQRPIRRTGRQVLPVPAIRLPPPSPTPATPPAPAGDRYGAPPLRAEATRRSPVERRRSDPRTRRWATARAAAVSLPARDEAVGASAAPVAAAVAGTVDGPGSVFLQRRPKTLPAGLLSRGHVRCAPTGARPPATWGQPRRQHRVPPRCRTCHVVSASPRCAGPAPGRPGQGGQLLDTCRVQVDSPAGRPVPPAAATARRWRKGPRVRPGPGCRRSGTRTFWPSSRTAARLSRSRSAARCFHRRP